METVRALTAVSHPRSRRPIWTLMPGDSVDRAMADVGLVNCWRAAHHYRLTAGLHLFAALTTRSCREIGQLSGLASEQRFLTLVVCTDKTRVNPPHDDL